MNKPGAIIVIDDDADDRMIFSEAFTELGYPNEIVYFEDGEKALQYINDDEIYPFLIFSDINMPKLNGFELKKMISSNLKLSQKCIPYLFFKTSASERAFNEAYIASAQGFFVKPTKIEMLTKIIGVIIEYWLYCYTPNSVTKSQPDSKSLI